MDKPSYFFKHDIQVFSDNKNRNSATQRPNLKDVFQAERKCYQMEYLCCEKKWFSKDSGRYVNKTKWLLTI